MLENKYKIPWASIFAIGFLSFIFWIIYMANTGQTNPIFRLVQQTPYGDKFGHFTLFGLLTFAINYGLKFRNILSTPLLLGTSLVFLFASVEELSQYYIPTRTLDLTDFIADVLGIVLFDYISRYVSKKKSINTTK